MGDGWPVGYARERALQAIGFIWFLCCTWDIVSDAEYAANQPAPKTKGTAWEEEATGLSIGCDSFGSRIFIAYGRQDGRRMAALAIFEAKERVREGETRRNMGDLKFVRLLRRLCDTHRSDGWDVVLHFGNASRHSRRRGHWVSHIVAAEGG